MTEIAQTLENILEHPVVKVALDRSRPVEEAYNWIKNYYKVNLEKRNPSKGHQTTLEGNIIPKEVDLDLFTFLNDPDLYRQIVFIPKYGDEQRISPKGNNPHQEVISDENRHGEYIGIVANKDYLSFSIRILDQNVKEIDPETGVEITGLPRNFAIVGYDGELRDIFKEFFMGLGQGTENFVKDKELAAGFDINFKYFVHPNRAFSIYSSQYLASKILMKRIDEEAEHYNKIATELEGCSIRLLKDDITNKPKDFEPRKFEWFGTEETVSEHFDNMEVNVQAPDPTGEYPLLGMLEDGTVLDAKKISPESKIRATAILRYAKNRARELSYVIGPRVTAIDRAIELAHLKNGFFADIYRVGAEKYPGWDVNKWEELAKPSKQTIYFARLPILDEVYLTARIHTRAKQVPA